jgi:MSHA pilin protein MshA
MKRQGGFTLIELVVVIVILGILAVTAAPKFLNLQSDARASSLQGLKGAMAGASGIVYGKAAIEGSERVSGATSLVDGTAIINGYPRATSAGIGAVVVGLEQDWAVSYAVPSATQVTVHFKGSKAANCTVVYTEAVDENTSPVITAATTTDC